MLPGAVFFILALLAFCDLISEQAILSNLPFLPISRELKVQIVDLILLKSSGASRGRCCRPHCSFLVVSPPVLARNGLVHGGDMLHFTHWCSPRPPEPLYSFRRGLSEVARPRKPVTTTCLASAPAPGRLAWPWDLGNDTRPLLASPHLHGVLSHSWHAPSLPSDIFTTLFLTELS